MSAGPRPALGVLAVALDGERVLLVQRAKAPDRGLWGYPGGHVEAGETVAEAALRELHEETGLTGRAGAVLGHKELIRRDASGAVTSHYYLVAVAVAGVSGAPLAADDAAAAEWVPIAEVFAEARPMSAGVAGLLRRAGGLPEA